MPTPDPEQLSLLLAILNAVAFFAYGIDKFLAKSGKRRISEKALLILTALLASPGGILGMVLFNHKTSKPKFRYGVPAILLAHAVLGYWLAYY
ncbi:DUF1294 domain-containing protein [Pelagicoccus albus]|uniref:DUF1294 domain-containing protein n=1 Tax=Pelagicoccus albus TaxID=415222 RepID=A0A7X1E775_9BACT|nr:DUF1294 domain-containing protein [Pelagicoccus albus]MBC2604896.1 DUF1294 domain-containing protein [Pelagicoccus albus]